jgi:hypothetical protein
MPFRHHRRVERVRQAHDDRVIGLVEGDRVTRLRSDDLRSLDQALRAQEPDRELRFVARRAHRDRDGHGLLLRARRADLEGRLADDAIRPDLERVAAHGHDGPGRDVPGRRDARVVHVRSVGPAAMASASLGGRADIRP